MSLDQAYTRTVSLEEVDTTTAISYISGQSDTDVLLWDELAALHGKVYAIKAGENNKDTIGFAGFYHIIGSGLAVLIFISPQYRQHMFGTAALRLITEKVFHKYPSATIYSKVSYKNWPARTLLEKVGFAPYRETNIPSKEDGGDVRGWWYRLNSPISSSYSPVYMKVSER